MESWRRPSTYSNLEGFVEEEKECMSLEEIILWLETESKVVVQEICGLPKANDVLEEHL